MIIGIDIRTLLENNYSGVNFYTSNLLQNILHRDQVNQYKFFVNSFKDKRKFEIFKNSNLKEYYFNWPNKALNFCFTYFNWPKIDRLVKGVDLFFLPNINFFAFSERIPLITTIYDLSFERYPDFYSKKTNLWHKIINPKKLLKRSQKVITISQSSKNDLIDLYSIPADKIEIIYPAAGDNFKPFLKNDEYLLKTKQKYELPENFILYLGNLEPRKNIEGLIQSFEKLLSAGKNKLTDNLFLVIAGKPSWMYKNIFSLAAKSKYKSQIKFLGYVDEDDKPALYNLAKIFVYPTFYEGFGMPVLEALSCGVPVITSANSSLPEVTSDAALLINPYKLNDITDAISQLLTDENLTTLLRQRGLNQAKKFSWQKSAEKLLTIFQNYNA